MRFSKMVLVLIALVVMPAGPVAAFAQRSEPVNRAFGCGDYERQDR